MQYMSQELELLSDDELVTTLELELSSE
jgi:hypothetical protein